MTFRPACFASNTTLMLNLELPPRSKKLSPGLTLSKRKTFFQISVRMLSTSGSAGLCGTASVEVGSRS